jgi:hypothetical protein
MAAAVVSTGRKRKGGAASLTVRHREGESAHSLRSRTPGSYAGGGVDFGGSRTDRPVSAAASLPLPFSLCPLACFLLRSLPLALGTCVLSTSQLGGLLGLRPCSGPAWLALCFFNKVKTYNRTAYVHLQSGHRQPPAAGPPSPPSRFRRSTTSVRLHCPALHSSACHLVGSWAFSLMKW